MKICMLGAGSWGIALTKLLALNGHEMTVWSIDPEEISMLKEFSQHKTKLPGVGASIGLDRLIAGLEQLGKTTQKGSYLDAEIFCTDMSLSIHYQGIASKLRQLGVNVEVFPEAKKMGQQYALAEAKSIHWGILIESGDVDSNTVTLKDLTNRKIYSSISVEEAAKLILAK